MVKGSVLQSLQKFGMDAFKAAVAHNQNNVSRLGFLADGGYDFLRMPANQGILAQRGQVAGKFMQVQAVRQCHLVRMVHGGDHGEVRRGERQGQFVLEDIAARGVGARFENGPDAGFWITLAQAQDGLFDGRGVVREVVHDGNAVHNSLDFLPARDALKPGQGTRKLLDAQPRELGGRDGHGRVADVEFPDHGYVIAGAFQREKAAVRGGFHVQDADVGTV